MKKRISLLLAASLLSGAFVMGACNQKSEPVKSTMDEAKVSPVAFETKDGLYVHALSGSDDTQAWHLWQSVHDEEFKTAKPYEKYFFLPTSADEKSVDIYNGYAEPVTVNGVEIPSGATEAVSYTVSEPYDVKVKDEPFSLRFMKSNAEAAVFINNSDADGKGTDLMTYLNDEDENYDKHLTATATGAILDSDGNIDNTPIKKIKGRGNTSWEKPKKSYNVNYESAVSVAGIKEGKSSALSPIIRTIPFPATAYCTTSPMLSECRMPRIHAMSTYTSTASTGARTRCAKRSTAVRILLSEISKRRITLTRTVR